MSKIVVIGSANMDVIIRVAQIPAPGETILARGVQLSAGGKGANQAAAIARLGGAVTMIACVGDDAHGQSLYAYLGEQGVDTSSIERLEGVPTGTAYINVADDGENNIVVNPGANHHVSCEMVERYRHLLEGADYCMTQLETPLPTLYAVAALCQDYGVRLILNPAPAAELEFERLKNTWMIIPNESELNALIPDQGDVPTKARLLLEKGFLHVLVTLGEEGCLLVDKQGEQRYSAYKALPVQDTTAAGDSFIGTLILGLSRGSSLSEAITLATKAAAITVSRPGAQASLPTWTEVEAILGHA